MDSDSDSNEIEYCPICLDYQNCDSIPTECCNKLIHAYCFGEWLVQKNNCPLCRTNQASEYNSFVNNSELIDDDFNIEQIFRTFRNIRNLYSNDQNNPFLNILFNNNIGVSGRNIRTGITNFNRYLDIPSPQPLSRQRRLGFSIPNAPRNRTINYRI